MQCVDELVGRYSHSCLWWFGPWFPILRLFHPEAVKPVLLESGSEGGPSAWSLCVCLSLCLSWGSGGLDSQQAPGALDVTCAAPAMMGPLGTWAQW